MIKKAFCFLLFVILSGFLSCSSGEYPLGSEKNPIELYFVPSSELDKIVRNSENLTELLEKSTGLKMKTAIPTSYAAVIESMGNGQADIAFLPTFAYVIAHEKYGVEPALKVVRHGQAMYRGQLLAQANSKIASVSDIDHKKVAFTDAASTSGFIYPSALFKQEGITPSQSFFAGGHSQAVLAVYEGAADIGCTYEDARRNVSETYPDVNKKVKVVGYTEWIPNDNVSFRKDFPADLKSKISQAFQDLVKNESGKNILKELYGITGLVPATDRDYDVVRNSLRALGKDAEEYLGD